MPAAPLVSTQAIVNALLEWRGDVSAAAHAVGISRNSLYERIRRLRLDLAGFRNIQSSSNPVSPITVGKGVTGMTGIDSRPDGVMHAQGNARAIYPAGASRRKLGPMEATVENEAPIKTPPQRNQPLRFKPEHRDRIREARIDISAKYRTDYDDSAILEQFIEDMLAGWVAGILGKAAAKNGKKTAATGDDTRGMGRRRLRASDGLRDRMDDRSRVGRSGRLPPSDPRALARDAPGAAGPPRADARGDPVTGVTRVDSTVLDIDAVAQRVRDVEGAHVEVVQIVVMLINEVRRLRELLALAEGVVAQAQAAQERR